MCTVQECVCMYECILGGGGGGEIYLEGGGGHTLASR